MGEERILLGLSGGVDSSVCAALLSKAVPGQLFCVFVDHGLLRKNEGDEVEAAFAGTQICTSSASMRRTASSPSWPGVTDPETKRKIIGAEFIAVFEEEAARSSHGIDFLAQGTIYPDVIESGANNSATIKSHHNVGGLPERHGFQGHCRTAARPV